MPRTGDRHASFCPFYGAPPSLSGLSVYREGAVRENDDHSTTVKLNIGLLIKPKAASVSGVSSSAGAAGEGSAKKARLSLLGLLNLLVEKSGFNRWSPAMRNKRRYGVFFKYMSEAARDIRLKDQPLSDSLYLPFPFSQAQVTQIVDRTNRLFYKLLLDVQGRPRRMIFVGLIHAVFKSKFGYGLRLKHAPHDIVFWLDETTERQLRSELGFNEIDEYSEPPCYILVIGLAERSKNGSLLTKSLDSLRLTHDFIPYYRESEARLLHLLIEQQRYFSKQLRYDAKDGDDVFPDFLVLDTGATPTPLYLYGDKLQPRHDAKVRELIYHFDQTGEVYWRWDLAYDQSPPPLPVPTNNRFVLTPY